MLESLPPEILDIVLRQLGARSLCLLVCVSRGLCTAVAETPLRVTLVPGQGSCTRKWLLDPKVQRRVVVLCVRRGSLPHSFVYPRLTNLRVLDVAFSFVPARLLASFSALSNLRILRLHRLSTADSAIFSTRTFAGLVHLAELAITIWPDSWALVCVEDLPASLQSLSIRHAPAMLVITLKVPAVVLSASVAIEFVVPMLAGVEHVSLECDETVIELSRTVDGRSRPRSMSVKCPGNLSLSELACVAPSLRVLKMSADVLFVAAAEFETLEDVELHAAVGLGISKSGPLPRAMRMRTTLGGVVYDFKGAIERYRQS